MKVFKVSLVILFLGLITFPFQNCGSEFNPEEYTGLSSSSLSPVSLAPQITSLTGPGSVGFGQPATLGVVASGENLAYQWYKDNVLMAGATSSTYQIASATDIHRGSYRVVVSNPHGSVNSTSLALDVIALPSTAAPVILSKTADQILPFFADVSVALSVTASGSNLTYEWTYIGTDGNGQPSTRPAGNTSTIMTLKNSFTYNGTTTFFAAVGTYRVVVRNQANQTATADINVSFEPIQIPTFPGGGFPAF